MSFWRALRSAWLRLLYRFSRVDEVRAALAASQGKYLDPAIWARIRGISKAEAEKQLDAGVVLGHLDRVVLYEGTESPAPFVVEEALLGSSVPLSDLGFIDEDPDREVYVSPSFSRKVFVARSAGQSG